MKSEALMPVDPKVIRDLRHVASIAGLGDDMGKFIDDSNRLRGVEAATRHLLDEHPEAIPDFHRVELTKALNAVTLGRPT